MGGERRENSLGQYRENNAQNNNQEQHIIARTDLSVAIDKIYDVHILGNLLSGLVSSSFS